MTPVALEWWLRPARIAARVGEQKRRCVELCITQTARCRASTPDQLARLEKRKEERGIHVPEAKLASGRLVRIRLPYDGLNNAGDEIPILGDVDRYNGLNVEHVLGTVIRPNIEVGVVLEGNANQAGRRVLHRLPQLFCRGLWSGGGLVVSLAAAAPGGPPASASRKCFVLSAFTLAERLCGTTGRVDTPRMSGSCNRLARAGSQASAEIVI